MPSDGFTALARGRVLAGELGRRPFELLLLPVEPRLPGPRALQLVAHLQAQPMVLPSPITLSGDLWKPSNPGMHPTGGSPPAGVSGC